jgi:hypothetical protein
MWEICDPENKTIYTARSEQDAKQWAKEKWPDCFFEGKINRIFDRIYIYDKDEKHLGYIDAPLSYFNEPDDD